MPDAPVLSSERDGDVVLLTLRRPERRNALNTELCRAIHAAVDEAVEAGARVLVVTGEGTAFCSGADLGGVYGDEFLDALYGMLHHLAKVPVPIVAAVNGPAIGAGTQLAMACDLRVADESAVFAVPTGRNGMAVDAWTIRTLAQLAGSGPARRLMLAAESLDRDAALGHGLADRSGTLDVAIDWARDIATLAPLSLAHNKLVLNGSAADDDAIAASFTAVWASEDVREGAAARAEKRRPTFTGR
ncbi:enoyl-CoA hydratase/isomerase family protein [Aeromicrobium marinum DSM 15272]|uniref:Enoyl-CoA hydratase/isomerase family protein n=1 Tax=Aeromicrobium marinum DSM 15272 TaxID=585531 RepID=E2SD65_9ACTN|nr:enoyl-CoA hydratase [Aeromicrobium marinum]EFQ83168.1 enoyl-CoA hydratase/isomerase family protein [Aeromicrobium marinum DSM 15272]